MLEREYQYYLDSAYAQYKPGTFLVHKCIPAEEEKREWAFLTRLRMRRRMAKMKGAA